jgi:hypothetical protein
MRVRSIALAALMAVAAPPALQAADMAGYVPVPAPQTCGGLNPVDVYVPPQAAYIVACTVPLPDSVWGAPAARGGLFSHFAKLWNHGAPASETVFSGSATREGKLVYLQEWSNDRPPVHFIVVPK